MEQGRDGSPAALDVTVISTMQWATIQGAASTQGHALTVGEARILAAHGDACQAVGVFSSHGFGDTWTGMSASAVNTLACLGHLLSQHLGIPLLTPPTNSSRSVPFPSVSTAL